MFSVQQVAEIRGKYASERPSFRKLAIEYGVTIPTIARVIRGEGGYATL